VVVNAKSEYGDLRVKDVDDGQIYRLFDSGSVKVEMVPTGKTVAEAMPKPELTTFRFGFGSTVPAHRHVNPDGSQGGWVADTAYVAPTAYVGVNARVYGSARVYGHAQVYDTARVCGHALVSDRSISGGYVTQ
jgi:hypothetical protein